MSLKIILLSWIHSKCKILEPVSKRQTMERTKVERKKGICPEFGRNYLDEYEDDHDDMTLVDMVIRLLL